MFKEKIKKDLKEKIIKELKEASEELDIVFRFDEDDIVIYGSIFDKENPNDIDVYVELNIDLNDSNEIYQVFDFENADDRNYIGEDDAINALKEHLHKNTMLKSQLEYEGKKVDINLDTCEFEKLEMSGKSQKLKEFISEMEVYRVDNQKRRLKESELPNILNNQEAIDKFSELANLQLAKPENFMKDLQKYMGGGAVSNMIEHIGDLTHRISQNMYVYNGKVERALENIEPKINNALRRLNMEEPLLEEFYRNIDSNFIYDKNSSNPKIEENTVEEFKERVIRDLKEYARLHSELPVYNDVQRYARDAAVCLGNLDVEGLKHNLESLDNIIQQEIFIQEASKYDPDYEKNTITNYLKSKISESKPEISIKKEKDDFKQELLKIIEKNKTVIDSMIPEDGLFSKNTYGTFEYSDEDPNVYFQSDKWKDVIRENFFQARNSKNDTKAEFKSLMNEYLEDKLKFFGHADLASKIITESIDLRKAFMNFKMSLSQVNEDALDPAMDVEDFREELLGELIDYIGNKDKTKPEDLYNNIDINLLISPIENPNYVEDSRFHFSEDYNSILLTEENIEILKMLDISKESMDRYYIQHKGVRLEQINDNLNAHELLTFESLPEKSEKNNMLMTRDLMSVIEKENDVIPHVLIKKSINDLLDNYGTGQEKIKLEEGVLCFHNSSMVSFFDKFNKDMEVPLRDLREGSYDLKEVPDKIYQQIHNSHYKSLKSLRGMKNN